MRRSRSRGPAASGACRPAPWRSRSVRLCSASAACSSSAKSAPSHPGTTAPAVTTTTRPRPPGPVADMSTELTGGQGVFMGEASPPDLQRVGYVAARVRGGRDGDVVQGGRRADARRPLEVRARREPRRTAPASSCARPRSAKAFSGTVVVEWLNVSGGVDADPDWTSLHEEIVRAGDAWVGVSAQRIGVEGGPVLVKVPGVPGRRGRGQGSQGDRPGALRLARAPGRRLLVRHLHAGRPRAAHRRGPRAGCSRSG